MARTESLDRKKLIESILRNNGIISAVAREFSVTPWTIYNYRDKYTSVATAILEARNNMDTNLLDGAELKLGEAVRDGEAWAIKYVLDKKGQVRGYKEVNKREVEHSGGLDVETQAKVTIYIPDNGRD